MPSQAYQPNRMSPIHTRGHPIPAYPVVHHMIRATSKPNKVPRPPRPQFFPPPTSGLRKNLGQRMVNKLRSSPQRNFPPDPFMPPSSCLPAPAPTSLLSAIVSSHQHVKYLGTNDTPILSVSCINHLYPNEINDQ